MRGRCCVMSDQPIRLVCPLCGSESITSWEQTSTGFHGVRWFLVGEVIEVDYDQVYDDTRGDDGGGYADDLACKGCGALLSESDLVPGGTDPNPDWSPPVRAERLSDEAALDAITALLDGRAWRPADDLEAIAELLRRAGRTITEPH
jgi:hypothetical protein